MPRERTDNARTRFTRHVLQDTVIKLLQTQPLQSISVKEVCQRAGINRSTFYGYYDNIQDLVADIENETLTWLDHAIATAFKTTLRADLEPVITSICQYAADNKDRVRILLSLKTDPQFQRRLISIILDYSNWHARAQSDGADPTLANMRLLFCIAGGLGLVQSWVDDGFSATPEAIAHVIYTQSLPPVLHAMAQDPEGPSATPRSRKHSRRVR